MADPANLQISITGDDATLTWDASSTSGVVDYAVHRRSPSTLAAFDPHESTLIASGIVGLTYADLNLAEGTYDWEVFGRADDCGLWTPASLPNLVGWWDASDTATITQSGGLVSQWNDKSGAGRHMVQATGSAQPATGSRTVNGLNGLDFDGSSDYMTAAIGTLTQPTTILAVVSVDTRTPGTYILYDANHASNRHQTWIGGGGWLIYAGTVVDTQSLIGPASTGAAQLVSVFNSTASRFFLNGSLDSGAVDAGTSTMTDIMVGASVAANLFDGIVCEVVVINAAISGADRTSWNAYTLAKWGV